MQDNIKLEAGLLVSEWGRWARLHHGAALGYRKPPSARMRGSTVPTPLVDDQTALWVDAAISRIESQMVRDAMVMRFVGNRSDGAIARELNVTRRDAATLVEYGLHQVAERLAG